MNSLFGMSRAAKRPRCQDYVESNSSLPTEVWSKVLQCKYNILLCIGLFKVRVYIL